MRNSVLTLICTASIALSGCNMTADDEKILTGAVIGAGAGLITGKVLDLDSDWVVLTTLAGAAIGALVARNRRTGECAYSNGNDTYRVARCP